MTPMGPMKKSDGSFESVHTDDRPCPKCGDAAHHTYRVWESGDGAYEDEKHTCSACGHVWWIDGIDS